MAAVPFPRIAAVLVLPATLVLVLGALMRTLDRPIEREGSAQAMVWSDRVFVSKETFSEWLEARGGDYDAWLARHPGVAPWEPPPANAATAAYVPPTTPGDGFDPSLGISGTTLLVSFAFALGLLLVVASTLPPRFLYPRGRERFGVLVIERRAEVAAAGLSLLVGAGLPVFLT